MRYRLQFLILLIVITLPGCMTYGYPYGYNYNNGYYGNPGVQQPGWTYPPTTQPLNQPFSQPSAPIFQPGTGNSNPTPIDSNNPGSNNWQTPSTYGNDNNAPAFDPNSPSSNNGKVPNPTDDSPGAALDSPLTPTTAANAPGQYDNYQQNDSNEFSAESQKFEPESTAENNDPFERPIQPTSGRDSGEVRQANRTSYPTETSKRYGHDPQFQWLKGVVEFDEKARIWVIMYDDNPPSTDDLGGELPLVDHPSLENLRSGDAVRIEGSFDPNQTLDDKPLYRIKKQ